MVSPRFEGQTYPRPRCGAVVGRFGVRAEQLVHARCAAYCVVTYVDSCRHAQNVRPLQADGSGRLFPVLAEAK
jgi:hypothetical protein